MYWQEDDQNSEKPIPDDVLEVVFSIDCRSLPVDHAYVLSQCVQAALPWFSEEQMAGMHTIHVAASANGWIRPDSPDQLLYPSRRTKFVIRIPRARYDEAMTLMGQTFDIDGHALTITKATTKKLSNITTLFARYVAGQSQETESEFLDRMFGELKKLDIHPKKMLCGMLTKLAMSESELMTRSLLLAELSTDESITLQEYGLGSHRHMGCGIFLPHKDIDRISEDLG